MYRRAPRRRAVGARVQPVPPVSSLAWFTSPVIPAPNRPRPSSYASRATDTSNRICSNWFRRRKFVLWRWRWWEDLTLGPQVCRSILWWCNLDLDGFTRGKLGPDKIAGGIRHLARRALVHWGLRGHFLLQGCQFYFRSFVC
jgi:hypothetical protein